MFAIGPYLRRDHGASVLNFLLNMKQESINITTWDCESGELVLATKLTARDILEEKLYDLVINDIHEDD